MGGMKDGVSMSKSQIVQAEGVLDIETNERLHVLTGAVCNNNCLFCGIIRHFLGISQAPRNFLGISYDFPTKFIRIS